MSTNALFRPLKDGKEFNSLFPVPRGKKSKLKSGDTYTSIDLIIKWALENHNEVKEVATKLKKSSLGETCFSIHDFLFNHFQYKADAEAQLLRSPAYAWKHRYDGIDCKSYSIIASCILLQLGIKHYIRKIKQASFNSENFTHVYVVVPVNQNTGTLENGYFTIDGTLKTTIEPNYIDKKDFYMDKLQHYGLNGVQKNYLNGVSFSDIGGLFKGGISCIGGTAYNSNLAKNDIDTHFARMNTYIDNINEAVKTNNIGALSNLVADFIGVATWNGSATDYKLSAKKWNSCSKANLRSVGAAYNFYRYTVVSALLIWLNEYFNIQNVGHKYYAYAEYTGKTGLYYWGQKISKFDPNAPFEVLKASTPFNIEKGNYGGWISHTEEFLTIQIPVQKFTLKPLVYSIPKFEFTPYIQDLAASPKPFDPSKFLQGLSTVLVSFQGNGNGTGTGTGTIDENGQIIYTNENAPKNTKGAGMVYLVGGLALTGLAVWGFSKMKDTGAKSQTKTKK